MKLIINKPLRLSKLGVARLKNLQYSWLVSNRTIYIQKIVLNEHYMKELLLLLENESEFEIAKLQVAVFEEITLIWNGWK